MSALLLVLFSTGWADEASDQAAAESAFDTVMSGNAVGQRVEALGYTANATPAAGVPPPRVDTSGAGGQVEVPLDRYEAVRNTIVGASHDDLGAFTTMVALGGSTYEGKATSAGLELHLRLDVTLRGAGAWKTVPLVGDGVAIVQAKVGGKPVPLRVQNGYQVWVTNESGEVTVDVDLLVPASGPRGSLEYEFLVPRTPVTKFDCHFPAVGIEPRLSGAVREDRSESGGATTLSAWLSPTSRIHLVGYHALDGAETREARVYAETLSLLSVEERTVELFTVLRYSILEAGTRTFDIAIPAGFSVVSADGAGAFRYTLETKDDGSIVHGETAFAIRDAYEVSLRLQKSIGDGKIDVAPPHAVGAERETGWIGLETIGTLQVEDSGGESVVDIGVGQLPAELVQNAVSPVLDGWRYHQQGAKLHLAATALPERDPVAGAIDTVVAVTTLAPEGGSRTTMTMTLRNRLRHSLAIRLPEGTEIRASRLDGQAVAPSKTPDGRVLLPLKRSTGTDRPLPFTLEIELVASSAPLGLVGVSDLALPQVELPISTLDWAVRAPSANQYTRLFGDISPQETVASTWEDTPSTRKLSYRRFWVAADAPARVTFGHIRGWLRAPTVLLTTVLAGWALARNGRVRRAAERVTRWLREGAARLRQTPDSPPVAGSWRARGLVGRAMLLAGTGAAAFVWFVAGSRLAYVLLHPW